MSPRHRRKSRRYRIDYAQSSLEHLKRLKARDRASVVDAIEERLSFEPGVETRNRKRMDENSLEADFELRLDDLRVYYGVEEKTRTVNILAVGRKDRNRVVIGGEAINL